MSGQGYAAPPDVGPVGRTSRSAQRSVVVTGVASLGFLVVALVVASYFGATFGAQTVLLALAVAVVPLTIVIPTFLWLDRFESEPTRYLLGAFLWGALVAALVAAVFNTSAIAVLQTVTDTGAALETTAVVVAPVVEEAFKGVLVLMVWLLLRHEFDGITDGMVYAGVCAAGFAFTENIQYLAEAYTTGGQEALTATFVLRCLLSPFAHPMFTLLVGVGVGAAATSRSWAVRVGAPVLGYAGAVLAHGAWNLAAVSGGDGFVLGYLLVGMPVFFAYVAFVVWARRREGRLIGTFLRPYADAGWLAHGEVAMLSSMPRRRQARAWARTTGGPTALASMRAFQDVASDLALLRRRMRHGAAHPGAAEEERALLLALSRRRTGFVPDPRVAADPAP